MTYKNDRAPPPRPGHLNPDELVNDVSKPQELQDGTSRRVLKLVQSEPKSADVEGASSLPSARPQIMPEQNSAMLDRAQQARIGALLRELFADVANAPVPNRLIVAMQSLSEKDKPRE